MTRMPEWWRISVLFPLFFKSKDKKGSCAITVPFHTSIFRITDLLIGLRPSVNVRMKIIRKFFGLWSSRSNTRKRETAWSFNSKIVRTSMRKNEKLIQLDGKCWKRKHVPLWNLSVVEDNGFVMHMSMSFDFLINHGLIDQIETVIFIVEAVPFMRQQLFSFLHLCNTVCVSHHNLPLIQLKQGGIGY